MLDWISDDSGSESGRRPGRARLATETSDGSGGDSDGGRGGNEQGGRRLSGPGEGTPKRAVDLLAEASTSGADDAEQACRVPKAH